MPRLFNIHRYVNCAANNYMYIVYKIFSGPCRGSVSLSSGVDHICYLTSASQISQFVHTELCASRSHSRKSAYSRKRDRRCRAIANGGLGWLSARGFLCVNLDACPSLKTIITYIEVPKKRLTRWSHDWHKNRWIITFFAQAIYI